MGESCQYDCNLSLFHDSELRIVQPPRPQTIRARILDDIHNVDIAGPERSANSQPNLQRLRHRFIFSILLLQLELNDDHIVLILL